MPTELVLLMAFFFVSFATFGLVMLADAKSVVVRPPKLEVAEGSAEASSPEAEAHHDEDAEKGTLRVRASVSGDGRARAAAQLGHEFEIRAKRPGRYRIVAICEHTALFRILSGPAKLHYAMHLNIKDKSIPIGELTYTDAGEKKIPAAGGYAGMTKKQMVTLKPGQPCKVSVGLTVTAEQTAAGQRVNCWIEAATKVKELQLRPTAGNLLS